jgi:EpsI family protein
MRLHPARTFQFTVATIAVGVIACWPTLQSLAGYWENISMRTYVHGYGVAAISVGLIWRARGVIDATGGEPCWPALVATGVLSFFWYVAWISGVEIGYQVLFPVILLAAVAGVVGPRAAAAVGFSIFYLYFAIPIWSYLNEPLRSFTTLGVTAMARVTGLPAYVESNTVYIPSGAIRILGGCSGIRYFIVALAIAALYGELERYRFRNRVVLLAVVAAMAILMNWVRVYGIVLDGHLTDMRGRLVAGDHELYGWILFAMLLVAVLWVARRFAPAADSTPAPPPKSVTRSNRSLAAFMAVLSALAIGPVLTAVARGRSGTGAPISIALPGGSAGWIGPTAAGDRWLPVYQNPDAEVLGEYRKAGRHVIAYLNAYAYQAQGHELVGYGDNLLGASGWEANSHRTVVAHAAGGESPYIEVAVSTPDESHWIVGYFYVVGGRLVTGVIPSKLYYALAVLQGRPWSGVVAAASKCAADCTAASAAVNQFVADNVRRLADSIPQGRAGT